MRISAILAIGNGDIIGLNGGLPWNSKGDMAHFRNLTSGHCVVMGYTTYLSIGRPLPKRTNIVVSRTVKKIEGCYVFSSIEDAVDFSKSTGEVEMFVIGGKSVYSYFADNIGFDRVYLTNIIL